MPSATRTHAPSPSDTPHPTATSTHTPSIQILDCNGVPGGSAKYDCCGVCDGDGTSCPQLCQELNNKPAKKKIKLAVTKITADTLKRINRELQCNRKSRSAKQRRTEAGELRTQIKFLLIGIEDQIKLCDTPFCTKTSYEELNTEIRSKLKKIVALNKLSQRQSLNACCQRASCGPGNAVGPNWKVKFSKFTNDLPQVRCD